MYEIKVHTNFEKEPYKRAIGQMIRYIIEGDIYIANMTRHLMIESDKPPLKVFYDLRKNNPSPFGAYMDLGEYQIICASPERFLKMKEPSCYDPSESKEPGSGDVHQKRMHSFVRNCSNQKKIKASC